MILISLIINRNKNKGLNEQNLNFQQRFDSTNMNVENSKLIYKEFNGLYSYFFNSGDINYKWETYDKIDSAELMGENAIKGGFILKELDIEKYTPNTDSSNQRRSIPTDNENERPTERMQRKVPTPPPPPNSTGSQRETKPDLHTGDETPRDKLRKEIEEKQKLERKKTADGHKVGNDTKGGYGQVNKDTGDREFVEIEK